MRSPLSLAIVICATTAQADTFAERWPAPVAVEPVMVAAAQALKPNIRKARNEQRGCKRIYYTKNKWRYWRCQR